MHIFGKIMSVLLTVTALFLVPITYTVEKQEFLTQVYIQTVVEKFVDSVRCKGYLTEGMYLYFINDLDAGGDLYTIRMKHIQQIYEREENFQYERCTYEKEILERIENTQKKYIMMEGDYFAITVCNRSETMENRMERLWYGRKNQENSIFASAGGRVRDEAWEEADK
ncbi:MAG: hypothetical protein RSA52_06015 [Acetivibrio sp.]